MEVEAAVGGEVEVGDGGLVGASGIGPEDKDLAVVGEAEGVGLDIGARPDREVAWAGPDGLTAALTRSFGEPNAGASPTTR